MARALPFEAAGYRYDDDARPAGWIHGKVLLLCWAGESASGSGSGLSGSSFDRAAAGERPDLTEQHWIDRLWGVTRFLGQANR